VEAFTSAADFGAGRWVFAANLLLLPKSYYRRLFQDPPACCGQRKNESGNYKGRNEISFRSTKHPSIFLLFRDLVLVFFLWKGRFSKFKL